MTPPVVNPATPEQLRSYRERHVIEPETIPWPESWRPRAVRVVCKHDRIRVFSKRGGGWMHDPAAIRALSKIERGEEAVIP